MRTTIKKSAFFLLALLTFLSYSTEAISQEFIVVNFKDGSESIYIPKEDVKRVEFEFKNEIQENYSGIDTVYMSAGSGRCYDIGRVYSNAPVTAKPNCEWIDVVLEEEDAQYNSSNYEHYYLYYVYAEANRSKEERTGSITFESEGAESITKPVVQRGYVSSLENLFGYPPRWDVEPVKMTSVELEWSDSTAYIGIFPNFGINIVSVPDWIDEYEVYDDEENEDIHNHSLTSSLVLKFKMNNQTTERTGFVILSDFYGEQLVVELTQKAMGYQSLLKQMNAQTLSGNDHYDFGFGSLMHIRDVMTGDMTVTDTGYDWFSSWAINQYMGEEMRYAQLIWNTYRNFIYQTNFLLAQIGEEKQEKSNQAIRAVALTFRAMAYLDFARMFEFLPNDIFGPVNNAGNNIEGLTVPIVTEPIRPKNPVINIPRATKQEMADFILNDLNEAEEKITYVKDASKEVPHLDVVYGLKARLYLWLGEYEKALEYAEAAVALNTGRIMEREDCLSKTNGFNDPSTWMWASTTTEEDAVVKTGILNWTSWMSPEAQYGYSSAGATSMIDAAMYNRMSNTDFRKLMYKAPYGHALEAEVPYIDADFARGFPEYASVKFRPNKGNTYDYFVGSASSYPIMRIEEIYFIAAEAAERINAGDGRDIIEQFMKDYRDPNYTFPTEIDAIDEILFQKRVELWGEGISFFDIKRANLSVTRGYEGTNVAENRRFNTDGRPAWMNICIVKTAKEENTAIEGYENPDPSNCYPPQY